jgi:hypothetical protein
LNYFYQHQVVHLLHLLLDQLVFMVEEVVREIGVMELPQREDLVAVVVVQMELVEVDRHPQLYLELYTLVLVEVDLVQLHRGVVDLAVLGLLLLDTLSKYLHLIGWYFSGGG